MGTRDQTAKKCLQWRGLPPASACSGFNLSRLLTGDLGPRQRVAQELRAGLEAGGCHH
jgi:hypothetical protein